MCLPISYRNLGLLGLKQERAPFSGVRSPEVRSPGLAMNLQVLFCRPRQVGLLPMVQPLLHLRAPGPHGSNLNWDKG